jgi:dolichol-phosphate mannosyltransferase
MKVYVVLPAFNEEIALSRLIPATHETLRDGGLAHEIVVVDDGSSDGTASIVSSQAASWLTLLRHARNQGLGRALETGLTHCLRAAAPGDAIVVLDADDTHPPALIQPLVNCLEGGADVAIASRFQKGGAVVGVPLERRFYSQVASWLYRIRYPARGLRDYTCGFRAYSVELLRRASARYGEQLITEAGFTCMLELILKLRTLGARFAEVPLVLRYDKKETPSKMRVARTIARSLKMFVIGVPRGS